MDNALEHLIGGDDRPAVLDVSEEEECVPIIARMLRGERIIRVDGHSGMGKSRIAKAYAKTFGWDRIEGDEYLIKPSLGGLYDRQIDKAAFAIAARRGLYHGPGIVLDGICLDYILPPLALGPEFRVYMLSIVYPALEADEARRRKRLGTDIYHSDVDPRGRADLVVTKNVGLEPSSWGGAPLG